jgi:phage baseplate assembly protein gpV
MNRLERQKDFDASLIKALEGWQAGIHTAYPAVINSFDPIAETCSCTLTVQAQVTDRNENTSWVTVTPLVDVPVHFPSGGGYTLTFPVSPGDECLVVLASRCIDAWWQSSGPQPQADLRMHDLSDGFAFVGFKSQPRVLSPGIATVGAQLRSDDGSTLVEVGAGEITLKAPSSVTINSPMTHITGQLVIDQATTINGLLTYLAGLAGSGGGVGSNITGDLIQSGGTLSSNGTVLHLHIHLPGSVLSGGNTGAPV